METPINQREVFKKVQIGVLLSGPPGGYFSSGDNVGDTQNHTHNKTFAKNGFGGLKHHLMLFILEKKI